MPIHKMSFEDGVFFTKLVGYANHIDARRWFKALDACNMNNDAAIVAVVDMLDVDRISPTLADLCEIALADQNILNIAIIINNTMTVHNPQIIETLKSLSGVHFFSSSQMAMTFARSQVCPTIFPYSGQTMMNLAAVRCLNYMT